MLTLLLPQCSFHMLSAVIVMEKQLGVKEPHWNRTAIHFDPWENGGNQHLFWLETDDFLDITDHCFSWNHVSSRNHHQETIVSLDFSEEKCVSVHLGWLHVTSENLMWLSSFSWTSSSSCTGIKRWWPWEWSCPKLNEGVFPQECTGSKCLGGDDASHKTIFLEANTALQKGWQVFEEVS